MSIFNSPDFLAFKPLDLENKLFLPSSKLYTQTMWKLNSVYQEIKEVLINFHDEVATEAGRFYQNPVETSAAWYQQAVEYSTRAYAYVAAQMWPQAEAGYRQVVADVTEFGQQTGEFWHAFYENPEEVTVSLVEPISMRFNSMVDASQAYMNASLETVEAYLLGLYSASIELFKLLIEQPGNTITALYQNMLSALLDLYFDLVSSLLSLF
ncbi:MAG: hypothetical protein ACU85E_06140 [Gammaproteobacteria bacterium]